MLYKYLKIQFMTTLTYCRFRLVVLNPGPGEPQLCTFCSLFNTLDSDHQLIMRELYELSVLDNGDIQNVQSRESPGPGLTTTGLDF